MGGFVSIGKIGQPIPKGVITVRCDRPNLFGNPYTKFKYGRNEACDLFERNFVKLVKDNPMVAQELKRLCELYEQGNHIHLLCWCHPKRCHTLTIKKFILSYALYKKVQI